MAIVDRVLDKLPPLRQIDLRLGRVPPCGSPISNGPVVKSGNGPYLLILSLATPPENELR